MPEPTPLIEDCRYALDVIEEHTAAPAIDHRRYDTDDGPLEIDYRPPCRYVDVVAALDGSHERAQLALRRLELDGEIVWLGSGVLFPNRYPWSRFARRAGPSIVTRGDTGPVGRRARDAQGHVRHATGDTDRGRA
jgi:hypothetical protein